MTGIHLQCKRGKYSSNAVGSVVDISHIIQTHTSTAIDQTRSWITEVGLRPEPCAYAWKQTLNHLADSSNSLLNKWMKNIVGFTIILENGHCQDFISSGASLFTWQTHKHYLNAMHRIKNIRFLSINTHIIGDDFEYFNFSIYTKIVTYNCIS